MRKLSKTQIEVLILLLEGLVFHDLKDGTLVIEDADNNSYRLRQDTFSILCGIGFLEKSSSMTEYIDTYEMTEKGKQYLDENHKEKIQEFI